MQAIETFKEALSLLKEGIILVSNTTSGITYFALYKEKIRVHNESSNYIISVYELNELFSKEKFYIYESTNNENLVSKEKDDEYYGWSHK